MGKNLTRDVPRDQAPAIQSAIDGYKQFQAKLLLELLHIHPGENIRLVKENLGLCEENIRLRQEAHYYKELHARGLDEVGDRDGPQPQLNFGE